jgi:hypothetical protein
MSKSRSVEPTGGEGPLIYHPTFSPGPWLKLGLKGGVFSPDLSHGLGLKGLGGGFPETDL